jgi:hypothetical protein
MSLTATLTSAWSVALPFADAPPKLTDAGNTQLLLAALAGIAAVVLLISWAKFHPFLALIIGAAVMGGVAGVQPADIVTSFTKGLGSTTGSVGLLIALGAMIGKLLQDSGGSETIVDRLIGGVSPRRLPWMMALIAFILGIPLFFEVGVVLLVPVVILVARKLDLSLMKVGIPALAGLSILHGFVPPHPGPLLAIDIVKADLSTVLLYGLVISVPTLIVSGPLLARFVDQWVPVHASGAPGGSDAGQTQTHSHSHSQPQPRPSASEASLGLAGAPDVARGDVVRHEHRAAAVDDLDATGIRDLEGLVVAAVLLGLLGHEAHVGHRAHRGRVEGAVDAAVVDDGLVDAGVGAVGDDGEGVGLGTVGAPHVAGGADHRRHRGVDDDVARHVQVGDALVGVHHRQARAVGQALLDGGPDLVAVGEGGQAVEDAAQTVVGGQAGRVEVGAEALEDLGKEGTHDVAEDDRVADLHHRGLEVHGEQHALGLGAGDLLSQEGVQGCRAHDGGVDDLTLEDGEPSLSTVVVPSVATCWIVRRSLPARTTDCSLERKSSTPMVATLVLLSVLQAPIEWGWLRA